MVKRNIKILQADGVTIVLPQVKKLACGDIGDGALADISVIKDYIVNNLQWEFPLDNFNGIPVGEHLGSFGVYRKFDRHNGVDLYCKEGEIVHAVEDGNVVCIEEFTGSNAGTPWWLNTMCVKVEGASGVVGYGEILPNKNLYVGKFVKKNTEIGNVTPVLRPEKLRKDIEGHSCSMLHMQIYQYGTLHMPDDWRLEDKEVPVGVIDPTQYLVNSCKVNKLKLLN